MGGFPDDLEQVYDLVVEHKLPQNELEEVNPKLIKDWLEQRCQFWISLLWKQWSVKNFTDLWKI